VNLLMASLCSLFFAVVSLTAILAGLPCVKFLHAFSYSAILMWVTLTALSLLSNSAGAAISKVERFQRLYLTGQKMKRLSCRRLSATCASSPRAGNSRAYRTQSHSASSNVLKDNSDDGESDSGDLPALPLPPVVPSLNFSRSFRKPNRFSSPWRFLGGLGHWRMSFRLLFTERRWANE
jgi:hypothetical protein